MVEEDRKEKGDDTKRGKKRKRQKRRCCGSQWVAELCHSEQAGKKRREELKTCLPGPDFIRHPTFPFENRDQIADFRTSCYALAKARSTAAMRFRLRTLLCHFSETLSGSCSLSLNASSWADMQTNLLSLLRSGLSRTECSAKHKAPSHEFAL